MKNIVISVAIVIMAGTSGWSSQSTGRAPLRGGLEPLLGEQWPGWPGTQPSNGWDCYRAGSDGEANVKVCVEFDDNDNARGLSLTACNEPFGGLDKIATRLVPVKTRGEYKGRKAEEPGPECFQTHTLEYEHLTMRYSSANCYGCSHASILITWKQQA